MPVFDNPYVALVIALGIGLLIGAERERRQSEVPLRSAAGIRTFAITSLLGAAAIEIGGTVLLSVATAGVIALVALAYYRDRSDDHGLTTEIALVATVVLGALAMREPVKAAALAVTVVILLAARTPMHRFVRDVLTPGEWKSALIFAAATLVVWPLIPDSYLGPFDALNPRAIWTIVIFIMAISAGGHVALRAMGPRYGLPAAGFASGFVSSSATIAAMGARAVEDPHLMVPAVAGAVLSTVATVVQVAMILAFTSPATLAALAVPLLFAGVAAVAYGLLFALRLTGSAASRAAALGEAFSLTAAVVFAAALAVVLFAAAALRTWLGDGGLVLVTAVAGFADAHALAVSIASQVASGHLPASGAGVPILVGLTTNTVTKIVVAVASGSTPFMLRVVPGLLVVLAAAWVGLLFGPG